MAIALAPLFPLVHPLLSTLFPDCLWHGHRQTRQIALTFDDGPHSHHTPQLLRVLDQYQVTASFFWLGAWVERAPEVARAVYQQGHHLGLHGYDHRAFSLMSPPELKQSLERNRLAIAQACQLDVNCLRDVRPPNGLFTPQTLTLLQQWNYRPVMWSVVPEDWVSPGVATVVQRVLQQTRNGSMIVLHDGIYGGTDVAEVTACLVPQLLQQGYEFVTVDQLWQQRQDLPEQSNPQAGV